MAKTSRNNDTAASLGFEAKLWQMDDGMRNNTDAQLDATIAANLMELADGG